MHYVIGDIHCQLDSLKVLLEKIWRCELYTSGRASMDDTKIYFVGDWLDRALTPYDYSCILSWVAKNIGRTSFSNKFGTFYTVCGNHDLQVMNYIDSFISEYGETKGSLEWWDSNPMLCQHHGRKIIEKVNMFRDVIHNAPLCYNFTAGDKEFIVTHSWLVDRDGKAIGQNGFNMNNIDDTQSIWDRHYSTREYDKDYEIPIIVHGHTPTLITKSITESVVCPSAKCSRIGDKNINVDCGAFFGPMLGGNLAAYCCETDCEIYAYDDYMFYYLAELWDDRYGKTSSYSLEDYMFTIIFYNNWGKAFKLSDCDIEELRFNSYIAKDILIAKREEYRNINQRDRMDYYNNVVGLTDKIFPDMLKVWESYRRFVNNKVYNYDTNGFGKEYKADRTTIM